MIDRTIAIITARGGSKRIPGKNVKPFLGYPIISYSIRAAKEAGCFEEIMVSTDDREIAEIAKSFGAKIPFFRSEKNSNDRAVLSDVLEEVIVEYSKIGRDFEYFCCMLPTAPFIFPKRLNDGLRILKETGADGVLPVVRFSYPVQRGFKIENGWLKMLHPEYINTMSRDLPSIYHDCGQFYWLKTKSFLEQKRIFTDKIVPMEIPESEAQDIDNEEDWKTAEAKYKTLKNS